MLREHLMHRQHEKDFHWRGNEIARIEGLSDAVFGFAVTLLVVSLEVPKTFNELSELMRCSDRIMVLRDGCVAGIFPGHSATQEEIMAAATHSPLAQAG